MNHTCIFNRMRQAFSVGLAVVGLLIASDAVHAQNRLSIELRPGANVATAKLGGATLNAGFGGEAILAYRFLPHLGMYGGWSWNRFTADQSFAGANTDFVETGYTYGLQFIHPIGQSRINYLVRAGGLYNHIEVENTSGDIMADSGHGFGWQAEAGVALPFGQTWQLRPSLRYRSLARDISIGTVITPVNLDYLSLGVGIVHIF